MSSQTPQEIMAVAERYVQDNLLEAAKEVIEWENTGILCDNHIRHVAALFVPVSATQALQVARTLVGMAVIRKFVKDSEK